MYEIGTQVTYHGSIERLTGETFTVVRHCCNGTRYTLDGIRVLHHVRHVSITPITTPVRSGAFRSDLERAIADEQPVMITYVAADGTWTTRTVEPYELARTRAGRLIVRAMDRLRRESRTFRLDRIECLDVLPGGFHLERPDFDREAAALARIRAEIAEISPGYYGDEMHWTPDCPILAL
ncbi:WYL domain-containing protein [Streptosporangium sp. NPDC051023]|uniref:helix-turn-helix transcriptional regulator n=1 Tax=Streptosporangium sp. NPDC051023 TaxID=3155410 RepID=UPI00344BAF11